MSIPHTDENNSTLLYFSQSWKKFIYNFLHYFIKQVFLPIIFYIFFQVDQKNENSPQLIIHTIYHLNFQFYFTSLHLPSHHSPPNPLYSYFIPKYIVYSMASYQGFASKAIHAGQEPDPRTGAVTVPISLATTFAQPTPGMFDMS